MYYEIYIDQFFAEHLLTGFLLLKLTALFLGREGSWKRILAASLANAAAVTLAVVVCTAGLWQKQIWTDYIKNKYQELFEHTYKLLCLFFS